MAAEIGLLSMTQIQKLSQSQHHQNQNQNQPQPLQNPNSTSSTSSWMWNPRENQEDDDSWEVRAFAEDTRNIMGTTWPPRSYTCTFCRREFRSAQALGGHMNVHRRDRARLHHQTQPCPININSNSSPTSSFIIPAEELAANGGLCLLYRLPSPNGTFTATPSNVNACAESPSTLLSISPYSPNNLQNTQTCSPSFDFPVARSGINSSYCNSSKVQQQTSSSSNNNGHEELDLELRLGHRPTPT